MNSRYLSDGTWLHRRAKRMIRKALVRFAGRHVRHTKRCLDMAVDFANEYGMRVPRSLRKVGES